jgi:hypothetical protein
MSIPPGSAFLRLVRLRARTRLSPACHPRPWNQSPWITCRILSRMLPRLRYRPSHTRNPHRRSKRARVSESKRLPWLNKAKTEVREAKRPRRDAAFRPAKLLTKPGRVARPRTLKAVGKPCPGLLAKLNPQRGHHRDNPGLRDLPQSHRHTIISSGKPQLGGIRTNPLLRQPSSLRKSRHVRLPLRSLVPNHGRVTEPRVVRQSIACLRPGKPNPRVARL